MLAGSPAMEDILRHLIRDSGLRLLQAMEMYRFETCWKSSTREYVFEM
jgi:hypothetical protein